MKFGLYLSAAVLALTAVASAAPAAPPTPQPRPFGAGHVFYHPTAIAPYRFENTIIRVRFDFDKGIVYGDETAIVHAKHDGLLTLPFNTLGIHYQNVTVNGAPVRYAFDTQHQLVNVRLPQPAAATDTLTVEFTYWTQPQRGIYFMRPDKGYPHVTPEIWSQGEAIDNRRWFPTWDEPNEKTPSELIITVPKGWTAVANGSLKTHRSDVSAELWDWVAPHPKSTYLIAFAAGPLSENHTTLGSLPVDSFVQPPLANENALCFGDTKDIVAHFQQLLDVPFPWAKYDQVTAERFTYGGMENASVTIQTDRAVHPAIVNLEQPCDGLVAHELSHQWFGDDASLADWSNAWLNEGFATYFTDLWAEKHNGEAQFEYDRYNEQQEYFGETKRYFRPIVTYVYNDPFDLFDASGYPRPGQIIHQLRYMYGDVRFFKALHDYLIAYQYQNATTKQFFDVVGKSLGTDLTWFKNEWFFRAAYPNYIVKQSYNAAKRTLTLDVTQKNHDGKPFRMPIVIEAYAGGHVKRVQPWIDRNHQVVVMTGISSAPQMVLFDPNNNVVRTLTFDKPVAALAYQATHAQHVADREWALGQLSNAKGAAARRAVRQVALHDPFYGVRSDATDAAAGMGDASTVLAALHDPDKRVRWEAEIAAATLKTAPAALISALRAQTTNADPNLAGAAYAALGTLKAPGAYAMLTAALNRTSFHDDIASGALRGLAALGDMRALPLAKVRTAYGTPENERNAAILTLARLSMHAKKPQLALRTFETLAQHDPLISTRLYATRALGMLGDPAALPVLKRIEANDSQQSVQATAHESILMIGDMQRMKGQGRR